MALQVSGRVRRWRMTCQKSHQDNPAGYVSEPENTSAASGKKYLHSLRCSMMQSERLNLPGELLIFSVSFSLSFTDSIKIELFSWHGHLKIGITQL